MMKKAKLSTLLLLILSSLLCLSGCGSMVSNTPDRETELEVPDALMLYSGAELGFSFLYPSGTDTAYVKNDGVYLYGKEGKGVPYVLIYRGEKSAISPEKYFSSCDTLMQDSFENVRSTPIYDVRVGTKQLYLTRYQCESGNKTLTIDRYLEPYEKFYIQYTAICEEADSMNTPLYYAISTLKTQEGAYKGAFSQSAANYTHADIDFSIQIPDMLDMRELTVGYMGFSQDAIFLAIHCTEDHAGKAIYNRQDFIDRAAADASFVTDFISFGESMRFTKGSKSDIGGVEFYRYPAELLLGGDNYNGAIMVANAADTGCYLLYYGVRDGCAAYGETVELLESCMGTFQER